MGSRFDAKPAPSNNHSVKMRFLCLHGNGTNSHIMQLQIAPLIHELDDGHEFDFVEATITAPISEGVETLSSPDSTFYAFYNPNNPSTFKESLNLLDSYIDTEGEFDGIIGFSGGAVLAAAYLINKHLKGARWDDWTALLAMPFVLAQSGIMFKAIDYGMGRRAWTLPMENLLVIAKMFFAIYFVYNIALFLAKASALLFFSRVFPSHSAPRWFTVTLYITHAMNLAWLVGITLGTIFMCNPVEKQYKPYLEGTCRPTKDLWIGSAVPSAAIDLMILVLPLPNLWKLQSSLPKKIGIMLVFVVGYGVVIVSLGRMIASLLSGDALNTDITYDGMKVVYWVGTEGPIILLSICAPAMLPLGRYLAASYFQPLASKVSLVLRSRTSTKNGSKASGSQNGRTASSESINKPGTSRSNGSVEDKNAVIYRTDDVELGSTRSLSDGQRPAGTLSPYQEFHSAQVTGRAPSRERQLPTEAIRVESDVRIDRQG